MDFGHIFLVASNRYCTCVQKQVLASASKHMTVVFARLTLARSQKAERQGKFYTCLNSEPSPLQLPLTER